MANQLLRLPGVMNTTGLNESAIYRKVAAGTFPKPIKLSERSTGWIASEVNQWVDDRIAESRSQGV